MLDLTKEWKEEGCYINLGVPAENDQEGDPLMLEICGDGTLTAEDFELIHHIVLLHNENLRQLKLFSPEEPA